MGEDINKEIVLELLKTPPQSDADVLSWKRKFSKKFGIKIISNSELLNVYRDLLKNKIIKQNLKLEKILCKRQVRTASGVSIITVLTKPYRCPGKCVYCPNEKGMPKSYLSREPAAQRAKWLKFDPIKQVQMRIKALEANGHQVDKIELIVLGGSWTAYTKKYQQDFITKCFWAASNYPLIKKGQVPTFVKMISEAGATNQLVIGRKIKTLEQEQKINEQAKYKIIGITLETRPDEINFMVIRDFRKLGCTRVQMGVQHTDHKILKLVRRGHTIEDVTRATKLLKDNGFKVDYHLMPDLPGSSPKKDIEMTKQIFENQDFKPDQVKIYPCIVNEHAPIYKWYKNKKYKPYSVKDLKNLLIKIKKITPLWVRINRLVRDIPSESIVAGNKITNLRQIIKAEMLQQGGGCKCIRCREVGLKEELRIMNYELRDLKLFIDKYKASGGIEYFISFESQDRKVLYGFIRLRLSFIKNPKNNSQTFANIFECLKNAALIRELHVYGQMTPVGDKIKQATQHKGMGRKLLARAEKIAIDNGYKKIAVIAGVGVREYYRKFSYKLKESYMVKELD